MHYGSLQGEPAVACHVFGGTGIAPSAFIGKPFGAVSVSRTGSAVYTVKLSERIDPLKRSVVAMSDQGTIMTVLSSDSTEVSVHSASPANGSSVDTNFYVVVVRTHA